MSYIHNGVNAQCLTQVCEDWSAVEDADLCGVDGHSQECDVI